MVVIELSCNIVADSLPIQLECISVEMSRLKSERKITLQSIFGVYDNMCTKILCVGLYVLSIAQGAMGLR